MIWLASAALGTWATPKASILTAVIAGFFIFPLTQMLLRLSGRRASLSKENPFNSLGMQVALVLPFSMLLVPVGLYNLKWFFPALMILFGRALFAFRYALRDAPIPPPRGNSHRRGLRNLAIFFRNVQSGRLGRRIDPVRFCLARPLHRNPRSFRRHSLTRLTSHCYAASTVVSATCVFRPWLQATFL